VYYVVAGRDSAFEMAQHRPGIGEGQRSEPMSWRAATQRTPSTEERADMQQALKYAAWLRARKSARVRRDACDSSPTWAWTCESSSGYAASATRRCIFVSRDCTEFPTSRSS
jgi:hypothetical protein